ncbi:MAG: peptidase M55 [Chitinivibrionales bacterium]|nr:peptidase M55 [Chitinivibrionales bacterium]
MSENGETMKILIIADMEGLGGVVAAEECDETHREYPAFCEVMTSEVNAAVEGAFAAGATDIVVNDCHNLGRNIIPEKLHPDVVLARGQPLPVMVAPLDSSFDAQILIGFHGKRGTARSVLDHTLTEKFHLIKINGVEYGEAAMAMAYAGELGIPTVFASGDDKLDAEIKQVIPNITTVVVKKTMSRTSALCFSPSQVRSQIRDGVRQALENRTTIKLFTPETPLELEIELFDSGAVDQAVCLPEVQRTGGRTITAKFENFSSLLKWFSILPNVIEGPQ